MPRRKTAPPRGILGTTAASKSDHARYHPSADLEAFVEHFWTVRWDLRGLPPRTAETLPHPSVHLVFSHDGRAVVRGVTRGKFSTVLRGKGGVFAAKFRPGGFYPFVRKPMVTLTNAIVGLGDVWGRDGDDLERAVLALADDDARMAVVEAFLRGRQPQPDERAALATTIVDAIAADRGILTVEDVTHRFGLNARTLQRLFSRYVGVNPKWVIQRYRLHEAAEQLGRAPASQAALAVELGYADQAHFVKDFKAVVGTSPAAYAKRVRKLLIAAACIVLAIGCLTGERRGYALYPATYPPPQPNDLATLTGYVERVDGRDVSSYGRSFELLPGCHLIGTPSEWGNFTNAGGVIVKTRHMLFALPMRPAHQYVVAIQTGQITGPTGAAVVAATEKDLAGNTTQVFPPVSNRSDIDTCKQWESQSKTADRAPAPAVSTGIPDAGAND